MNLASRIEGVNKVYGTEILVSKAVVEAISNGVRFREVDTVRVKGKNVGITVFTPCSDDELIGLSSEALAAYRAGRFDAAGGLWKRILAGHPGDAVTKVFLEKLALYRAEGVPADFDGINTLDSK